MTNEKLPFTWPKLNSLLNKLNHVNIQPLESLDDVDALMPGDVVRLHEDYTPSYLPQEELFAYCGDTELGMKRFIAPKESRGPYILMQRAYKEFLEVDDGVLIVKEDHSVAETFNPRDSKYEQLNEILTKSGLNHYFKKQKEISETN